MVKALTKMTDTLDDEGLINEARELEHFYRSVEMRVQGRSPTPTAGGPENPPGPLRNLLQERQTPKKPADPGSPTPPVEVVDFITRLRRRGSHVKNSVERSHRRKRSHTRPVHRHRHLRQPDTQPSPTSSRTTTCPEKYASELPRQRMATAALLHRRRQNRTGLHITPP